MPIQYQENLYRSNEVLRNGEPIHGNQVYNVVGSDQIPYEGVSGNGNINTELPGI